MFLEIVKTRTHLNFEHKAGNPKTGRVLGPWTAHKSSAARDAVNHRGE